MAFDPLLPRSLEQHGTNDGRIRIFPSPEKMHADISLRQFGTLFTLHLVDRLFTKVVLALPGVVE